MDSPAEIERIDEVNLKQLIAGLAILFLGVCLYLHDRRPDQAFFIYAFRLPSFYNPEHQKLFRELSSNLPSFLHVCSFSLLTCALLPSQSRKRYLKAGIFWIAINTIFEVGQLITPSTFLNVPVYFSENRAFMHILRYFQYGTFDFLDIIFSILGGLIAYYIQIITFKGGDNEIRSSKVN